jgi:hypothetical protein
MKLRDLWHTFTWVLLRWPPVDPPQLPPASPPGLRSPRSGEPVLEDLPNRRYGVTERIEWTPPDAEKPIGIYVTANVAEGYACGPRVIECFLRAAGNVGKVNNERDFHLNDDARMLSAMLRMGFTPRGLRARLGAPDHAGRSFSIPARACDELVRIQDELTAAWIAEQKAEAGA